MLECLGPRRRLFPLLLYRVELLRQGDLHQHHPAEEQHENAEEAGHQVAKGGPDGRSAFFMHPRSPRPVLP